MDCYFRIAFLDARLTSRGKLAELKPILYDLMRRHRSAAFYGDNVAAIESSATVRSLSSVPREPWLHHGLGRAECSAVNDASSSDTLIERYRLGKKRVAVTDRAPHMSLTADNRQ